MATIPTGQFGTRIAASPGRIQLRTDMPILDAQDRVLAIAGRIGADMQAREDAAQKERERAEAELRDKADQAQTIAGVAEVQSSLKAKRDELVQGIATRQIDKAKADQLWRDESSKVIGAGSKLLPQSHAQVATARLQEHALGLGDGIRSAVQRQDMEDTRAGLMTYLEATEREVLRDPHGAKQRAQDAIDQLGPWAGLGADDRQRLAQSFREKATYNVAGELVRTARDDMGALDKVLTTIKGPDFADLDPGKLGQLEQQVLGRKQYLLHQEQTRIARAEAIAARREREAEGAFKAVQGLIDSGAVPDEKFLAQVQGKMAGTAYAPALTQLLGQANDSASFALLTPRQQEAALMALRSKANAEGSNPSLERRLANWERISQKSAEQLKEEPLLWGMQRRRIGPVQPLQFANPDQAVAGLGERVQQAQTVQDLTGDPVSPFLRSEAQQLKRMLDVLPTEDRARTISSISKSIGVAGAAGLAKQMDKEDRALALQFAYTSDDKADGRLVSALIGKGAQAMKDGTSTKLEKVPEVVPAKWKAAIASQLDGLYPAETLNEATRDAALYIAHGLAAEKGGALQRRDLKRAVNLAIGGTIIDYNGRRIPLPDGIDEGQLNTRLRTVSKDEIRRQAFVPRQDGQPQDLSKLTVRAGGVSVPVDEFTETIAGQQLMPVRKGVYAVLVRGRPVVSEAGRVITVAVDRSQQKSPWLGLADLVPGSHDSEE